MGQRSLMSIRSGAFCSRSGRSAGGADEEEEALSRGGPGQRGDPADGVNLRDERWRFAPYECEGTGEANDAALAGEVVTLVLGGRSRSLDPDQQTQQQHGQSPLEERR